MTHGQSAFLVALGVLFMWLCWKDYGWFYFLAQIPKRSFRGTRLRRSQREAEWDRVMTRFLFFLLGLGLALWQLGSILGFWTSTPDQQG